MLNVFLLKTVLNQIITVICLHYAQSMVGQIYSEAYAVGQNQIVYSHTCRSDSILPYL